MSKNTPIEYRKMFIYQVYIRNHTKEGTFKAFIEDLDRIKGLGVNTLLLLPIHSIGEKNKKGSLGSPYSISDFKSINQEYGTITDFKNLLEEAHKRNIKVIMDIVFNHTSYDSKLLQEYPKWFYYDENGRLANKVADWSDITDLDFRHFGLWKELVKILKYWINIGIDGFRCDVASMIPIEFWEYAALETKKIKKDIIWFSESIHGHFLKHIRDCGFICHSESEIYNVFDIAYDYDTQEEYMKFLKGEASLKDYLKMMQLQEYIYPQNYVKVRNLENHDNERIASLVKNKNQIENWTACIFFQKGATMIYAGQENLDDNRPSLFDKDIVNWDKDNISNLITKLAKIVQDDIFTYGNYYIETSTCKDIFCLRYENKEKNVYGIFNVGIKEQNLSINIKSGKYKNLIDNSYLFIKNGEMKVSNMPLIFEIYTKTL